MAAFINTHYKNKNAIVQINRTGTILTAADYFRDVKIFYNIQGSIAFNDKHTKCTIPNEILVAYVEQYQSAPGWCVEIIDNPTDEQPEEAEPLEIGSFISLDNLTGDSVELNSSLPLPSTSINSSSPTKPLRTKENFRDILSSNARTSNSVTLSKPTPSFTVPHRTLSAHNSYDFIELTVQTTVKTAMNTEILQNLEDIDLQIIFANYKNSEVMENSQQIKLAKIITKAVLQKNISYEFNRQDFIYLADVICHVFSGEIKETYYTPALYGQKPSGKLYDSYCNYRRLLSNCGLLVRRQYSSLKKSAVVPVQNTDVLLAFDYVKTNHNTSAEFIENWKQCITERQTILKDSAISTSDYLLQFPVFKVNNDFIFKLFLADVEVLYQKNVCYDIWNDIYRNIFVKAIKIKDLFVQNLIKEAANCNESAKKAIAFMILPYFFPSTTVKSRLNKKAYKASRVEVQEKFVVHFDTLQKADNNERKLQKLKCGYQPRIVFVGKFEELSAYVTLIDKKYHFDNPLDAIRNCFAAYLSLNIRYPVESL